MKHHGFGKRAISFPLCCTITLRLKSVLYIYTAAPGTILPTSIIKPWNRGVLDFSLERQKNEMCSLFVWRARPLIVDCLLYRSTAHRRSNMYSIDSPVVHTHLLLPCRLLLLLLLLFSSFLSDGRYFLLPRVFSFDAHGCACNRKGCRVWVAA